MAKKVKVVNDTVINIMMMGGRRCGKTTVLAEMVDLFDKKFGNTDLTIRVSGDNSNELFDRLDYLTELYKKIKDSPEFYPNDKPSDEINEYTVNLSIKGKTGDMVFNFIDFPGEWLVDGSHNKDLDDCVNKSSVIIVAIDTPLLMQETSGTTGEDIGEYNERGNRSKIICNLLKKLDFSENSRMVLFVPLKSERYLHDGKMELAGKRIHTAYESFFQHIKSDTYRDKCTAAIVPVFTLGTAEFAYFGRQDGKIELDEKYKTPKYSYYRFTEDAKKDASPKPQPQYCEQPMLYVLMYVLKYAEQCRTEKYNSNIFQWISEMFGEVFLNMPSAGDFLDQAEKLREKLVIKGNGYELVSDAIGLKKEGQKC